MSRIGKRQLDLLASIAGLHRAMVVPDEITRSLCKRGLMVSMSTKSDGFLVLTSAGYRAVADAMDRGDLVRAPVQDWHKQKATP